MWMEDPGIGSNEQQSDAAARSPEVEWVWRWVSRWGASGSCCPLRTLFLLLCPCLPGLDPGFGSTVANTERIQTSPPVPRCPWGLWGGVRGQDTINNTGQRRAAWERCNVLCSDNSKHSTSSLHLKALINRTSWV